MRAVTLLCLANSSSLHKNDDPVHTRSSRVSQPSIEKLNKLSIISNIIAAVCLITGVIVPKRMVSPIILMTDEGRGRNWRHRSRAPPRTGNVPTRQTVALRKSVRVRVFFAARAAAGAKLVFCSVPCSGGSGCRWFRQWLRERRNGSVDPVADRIGADARAVLHRRGDFVFCFCDDSDASSFVYFVI